MDQAEIASFVYVPKVFVVCNQVDIASIWGYILRQKGISVILETIIEKAIKRWYVEASDLVVVDVDTAQKFRAIRCPNKEETMIHKEVIDTMMKRRSVRKYTDQQPDDEVVESIVRAGQQAPFAGQLCSVILTRKKKLPWGAGHVHHLCGFAPL